MSPLLSSSPPSAMVSHCQNWSSRAGLFFIVNTHLMLPIEGHGLGTPAQRCFGGLHMHRGGAEGRMRQRKALSAIVVMVTVVGKCSAWAGWREDLEYGRGNHAVTWGVRSQESGPTRCHRPWWSMVGRQRALYQRGRPMAYLTVRGSEAAMV